MTELTLSQRVRAACACFPVRLYAIPYDSLSRTHTVTDAKSHVSTLSYDLLDRRTEITYNYRSTVSLTFDADGNVAERDETSGVTTKITAYAYDKLNRLTREDLSTEAPCLPLRRRR